MAIANYIVEEKKLQGINITPLWEQCFTTSKNMPWKTQFLSLPPKWLPYPPPHRHPSVLRELSSAAGAESYGWAPQWWSWGQWWTVPSHPQQPRSKRTPPGSAVSRTSPAPSCWAGSSVQPYSATNTHTHLKNILTSQLAHKFQCQQQLTGAHLTDKISIKFTTEVKYACL